MSSQEKASLPPDLRVLCRRLTSTPPNQLPHAIPALVNHVLRCKDVLSAPHDAKAKQGASEASMLVHKLKTIITKLLDGKNAAGRFTGAALAKAVVDVGGWECLRESGPWVRSLVSIIQKNDPLPAKELCVVSVVRMYTLLSSYQTLVREIVTPSLDTFYKACLNLIKPSSTTGRPQAPLSTVEIIMGAFSALIPLYPTTSRPFNGQIRTSTRKYLAPTSSDDMVVPMSLQRAARRLTIALHHTTSGKAGPSEDWARLSTELIRDFHLTADQVFRAVQEGWEPRTTRTRSKISYDSPPKGEDGADQLPQWTGVRSGSERLIGLTEYMADMLKYPTRMAVTLPVGALLEAIDRVSLISRASKSQTWEQALETHAAVGREEKEELWSVMPSIHVAALKLLLVIFQRLGQNALPLVSESLDSAVQMTKSGLTNSQVRTAAYELVNEILRLCGPGMSKLSIDAISVVMLSCCRDLQQESGHLAEGKPQTTSNNNNNNNNNSAKPGENNNNKKNGTVANADLFLPTSQGNAGARAGRAGSLSAEHHAAADALLATLLSQLPQRHLKPGMRGLLDQTAILTQSRDAMLASVLHPYIAESGKSFPTIFPHLSRRFPDDQGVEVLRSNIRTSVQTSSENEVGLAAVFEELADEPEDEESDEEMEQPKDASVEKETGDVDMMGASSVVAEGDGAASKESAAAAAKPSPFLPLRESTTAEVAGGSSTTQKRKLEDEPETPMSPQKRQETEIRSAAPIMPEPAAGAASGAAEDGGESDDDESVHLNMDLDDLDDDDEEEDE